MKVNLPKLNKEHLNIFTTVLITLGVLAFISYQVWQSNSALYTPKNLKIDKITATEAQITWETDKESVAILSLGDSIVNISPVAKESAPTKIHKLSLSGLSPETTYYLKLTIKNTDFTNDGVPWLFKTLSFIESGAVIGIQDTPANTPTPTPIAQNTNIALGGELSGASITSSSWTALPTPIFTPSPTPIILSGQNVTPTPTPNAPQSTNYKLRDFAFGSGGVVAGTSTNFSIFGIGGEVSVDKLTSANFKVGAGLPYTVMPGLPPAPSLLNAESYYDRLKIIINPSSNATDTTYAIAITESSDSTWAQIRYVQDDGTISNTLGLEDFKTYANWGGASGHFIYDLMQNTTYKVKVKARQGKFTETGWGVEAAIATDVPFLSFGVNSNTVTFDELSSDNNYSDSTKSTITTTSTNAYNGYLILAYATQPLTFLTNQIANFTGTNAAPLSFAGEGFGYTTSDSNLTGGAANRFTNGGPKYAGFTLNPPGEPIADNPGPVLTPILNEQFTVSYRVTVDPFTIAGNYKTTIIYIVVPTF
jgi:hypothetical protein